MAGLPNDLLLTLILLALAIYFSVLVAWALSSYLQFRRLAPTALLSWPARRPRHLPLLVGLGVVSFAVRGGDAAAQRLELVDRRVLRLAGRGVEVAGLGAQAAAHAGVEVQRPGGAQVAQKAAHRRGDARVVAELALRVEACRGY